MAKKTRPLRSVLASSAWQATPWQRGAAAAQGFTPTVIPTSPPPGTYDPALDATNRAAHRGYGDLVADTETDSQRADSALGLNLADVQRGRDQANQDFGTQRGDVERSSGRSLADLLSARARGAEDHTAALGSLARSYARLGVSQGEQSAQAGNTGGGTLAAALRARTANEGIDAAPINTNFNRFNADSATSETRIGEDKSRALSGIDTAQFRANENADLSAGRIGTDYQYGVDDRATKVGRAGRELGFFDADTGTQKSFQAANSGLYQAPVAPANEFSDAKGPYRLIKRGTLRLKLRPNGTRERA